jgi:hypothetical protein
VAESPGVSERAVLLVVRGLGRCAQEAAPAARAARSALAWGEGKASAGDKTALDTYTVLDRRRLRIRRSTYLDGSRPRPRSRREMRDRSRFRA